VTQNRQAKQDAVLKNIETKIALFKWHTMLANDFTRGHTGKYGDIL
jgi:hypothetical protein